LNFATPQRWNSCFSALPRVKKKEFKYTSSESYCPTFSPFPFFASILSFILVKTLKFCLVILAIVTYVTPGLKSDYHHSIAFKMLHFLRVLYHAPFLMTLSQREKGKTDI
jgi:hypothetical protein